MVGVVMCKMIKVTNLDRDDGSSSRMFYSLVQAAM